MKLLNRIFRKKTPEYEYKAEEIEKPSLEKTWFNTATANLKCSWFVKSRGTLCNNSYPGGYGYATGTYGTFAMGSSYSALGSNYVNLQSGTSCYCSSVYASGSCYCSSFCKEIVQQHKDCADWYGRINEKMRHSWFSMINEKSFTGCIV